MCSKFSGDASVVTSKAEVWLLTELLASVEDRALLEVFGDDLPNLCGLAAKTKGTGAM